MIFIAIMDFVQQLMIINSKNLILQQSHIRSFVFDLLQGALLLLVVAHQMIVFSLLLHQLMIYFEKFVFCVELLRNIVHLAVVGAPEINKSISFDYWVSVNIELRYIFHFRAFEETVDVIVFLGGARPRLIRVTVNGDLVCKFSNGGFSLLVVLEIGKLITCVIDIRNITNFSGKPAVLIILINIVEVETGNA